MIPTRQGLESLALHTKGVRKFRTPSAPVRLVQEQCHTRVNDRPELTLDVFSIQSYTSKQKRLSGSSDDSDQPM